MIEGINSKMNINVEEYLKNDHTRGVMLAEEIIQYRMNGYTIDQDEINNEIKSEHISNKIRKYII